MRFFNTSGPVVAADHYCVPPSHTPPGSSICGPARKSVTIIGDRVKEEDETFYVRLLLTGRSPPMVCGRCLMKITIIDDD